MVSRRHPGQAGFTLAELLLVVTLLALVSGLGGGMYVGSYKRMQVERSAKEVLLLARYARLSAIAKQQPYQMHLDRANRRCWLTTPQRDVQTMEVQQAVVMTPGCKPVMLASSVEFEAIEVTPASASGVDANDTSETITFTPGGSADAAMVQVGDLKTHYTLRICGTTGKTRIEVGEAKEVAPTTLDLEAD